MDTSASPDGSRTSLLTDHYELTMFQAAFRSGTASRRSVFHAFARGLPPGRRYGIVAGAGRLLEGIANFRFNQDDLDFLAGTHTASLAELPLVVDRLQPGGPAIPTIYE